MSEKKMVNKRLLKSRVLQMHDDIVDAYLDGARHALKLAWDGEGEGWGEKYTKYNNEFSDAVIEISKNLKQQTYVKPITNPQNEATRNTKRITH